MGEIGELWQQYAQSRDIQRAGAARPQAAACSGLGGRSRQELRQMLIEAYAPLARYVVDRLNVRPGPALGYDDLLGEAVVGLMDAVDRFDPARGIKFETYAYHRIRGAVMDMLREMDWVPRSVRQKESHLAEVYARLEGQHGRPPTDAEIAASLGIPLAAFDELAQEVALQALQSLDDGIGYHLQEAATLGDLIADQEAISPAEHVERQSERDIIARAIELLPECERTVITLYYYEGLTLKEIGRVLGVTESRACQIHGKAVTRLRGHIVPALASPEPAAAASSSARG